jgi:hypothetical protein
MRIACDELMPDQQLPVCIKSTRARSGASLLLGCHLCDIDKEALKRAGSQAIS